MKHNTKKYHGIKKKQRKRKRRIEPTLYTGVIDIYQKGIGYISCPKFDQDIYISAARLNKALNGDTVSFSLLKHKRNAKREGMVKNVVKRAENPYVGIIQVYEKHAFVIPTTAKIYKDIFIPIRHVNGAKNGEKVIVKIIDWPVDAPSPIGKVEQVLGNAGEHQTEIHSILAEYGLPHQFPKEIEEFARGVDTEISPSEIAKRKDLRKLLTYTIDPKDAKDFDDALSFDQLANGNYQVGIHIADVSHYVKEGDVLDVEALARGTSVYLVDRVIPMLPEVLSNGVCSLRPNEDKYTFSVIFEMNSQAEILNSWFGKTIIHSDARFAYEEVQHLIKKNKSWEKGKTLNDKIPKEISLTDKPYRVKKPIVESILILDQLAKILRKNRMNQGAISFDKIEVKFLLDSQKNPVDVYFKTSENAHQLIEEFMLLANRKVAELMKSNKYPFVYRVHDKPDPLKLDELSRIVNRLGYQVNFNNSETLSNAINQLLSEVSGTKEQNLIDTLAIRSMSKAEYSTQNIGHFGLAFKDYTHFTSPIRRYPDILVHRLLEKHLKREKAHSVKQIENQCVQSTNRESLAVKAERDSIKYMQIKFMEKQKGKNFIGAITGVTEWGIYVELEENLCEGMIRMEDIKGDHYQFDRREYAAIGRNTKKRYRLGDEVIVKVKNTDLRQRHLDFTLVRKGA